MAIDVTCVLCGLDDTKPQKRGQRIAHMPCAHCGHPKLSLVRAGSYASRLARIENGLCPHCGSGPSVGGCCPRSIEWLDKVAAFRERGIELPEFVVGP